MRLGKACSLIRTGRVSMTVVLYPLAHLVLEIYSGMLAVMWPLFAARFGLSYGAVGLLNMIFRSSMNLPQPAFAAVTDRYGSRLVSISGLVCMALGMGLVGLAPNAVVLGLILALAPLGAAAFHPAGATQMNRALPRRLGTGMALFLVGHMLGSSLGPVLGAWLYVPHGVSASPAFIPLGLVWALLMLRLVPPDHGEVKSKAQPVRPRARVLPAMLLLVPACVGQFWIDGAIVSYLPLLYTARGLSLSTASQALFLYSLLAAGGVFVGGALSDRLPRWCVVALAYALTMPCYIAALLLTGRWALLALAGLGFVSCMSHSVTPAIAQELMPDRVSLASALSIGFSIFVGSLGTALTGFLADHIGMQVSLLLLVSVPAIGMACILAMRAVVKQRLALVTVDNAPMGMKI